MAPPRLTANAVRQALDEFDRLGRDAFLRRHGFGRAKTYYLVENGRRYDSKAIAGVAHGYAVPAEGPLSRRRFSGGEVAAARYLRALGFMVMREPRTASASPPKTAAALNLPLYGTTTREETYALFGVKFDQRQRYLLKGLSPRLRDGGYFIWITLDKSNLGETYDYEDDLQRSSFTWVTQRGVNEDHPDYIALRQVSTRVSLFVRNTSGDKFTYLGEMRYDSHQQFAATDGRAQMRYVFQLDHQVPEVVLTALYTGNPARHQGTKPRTGTRALTTKPRTRRPTTFGEAKEAFAYAVGAANRTVVPAHYNYQVRLQRFLGGKGVQAEWERDFVDVRFEIDGRLFIGEIKVTSYLTLDEAVRSALGQLLFYGHMQFEVVPGLVMLLDRSPDAKRLALATALNVSVVVEREAEVFELLNPEVAPALLAAFPGVAAPLGTRTDRAPV